MPTPHVCARRHTVRSGSTTDLGVLLPLPLPGRQRGHRRGIRGKANFQTSVVRRSHARKSHLSEQCGGQQCKDVYDIAGKGITGKDSVVHIGNVNTGRELTPSGRVKRASLTAVCKWVPSAWVCHASLCYVRSRSADFLWRTMRCGIATALPV